MAQEVVLALDWTPNINHVGFFVAHARGYFDEVGVKVIYDSPHTDDYKVTPAKKVTSGTAHVAICPSETVINHACQVISSKTTATSDCCSEIGGCKRAARRWIRSVHVNLQGIPTLGLQQPTHSIKLPRQISDSELLMCLICVL